MIPFKVLKRINAKIAAGKPRCILAGGVIYLKLLMRQYGDILMTEVARLEEEEERMFDEKEATQKKLRLIKRRCPRRRKRMRLPYIYNT